MTTARACEAMVIMELMAVQIDNICGVTVEERATKNCFLLTCSTSYPLKK
jgi:hypothetical protein